MEEAKVAQAEAEKWYHWHRFALLPHFRYRKAEGWNTSQFRFHWLVIHAWSMDCVWFGAQVELDDMQFQARVHLPYLIVGIFIPVFPWQFHQKLWRKSPSRHELEVKS